MEEQFVDAEEYQGQNKEVSFRSIILNHINKISKIATSEYKEGYWCKKPTATAGGVYMSETYIEDKRDAYINAVDFLNDVLLPHFDKDMNDEAKKIKTRLDDGFKKFKPKKDSRGWIDEKLLIKRKLFQELNKLLARKNYLSDKKFSQ